jgi:Transglutaminase-like superfamily
VNSRLSPLDWLAAWGAALVAPPLTGTTLLKRATVPEAEAGVLSYGACANEQPRAMLLASFTEQRVRRLARLARAPGRLGLPTIPGWRDTCLSRAYAATLALRSRGFPAILALGVRSAGDLERDIAAHAWVTLDGRALVDPGAAEYAGLAKQPDS